MPARINAAAIALLFLACGHKSPEEQLLNEVQPAASWIATLQFAAECWLVNSVPTAFVQDAIDAGEKAFDKATRAVDDSEARREVRDSVRQQLHEASIASNDVRAALSRGDRAAVGRARMRFATAHRALDVIRERIEP